MLFAAATHVGIMMIIFLTMHYTYICVTNIWNDGIYEDCAAVKYLSCSGTDKYNCNLKRNYGQSSVLRWYKFLTTFANDLCTIYTFMYLGFYKHWNNLGVKLINRVCLSYKINGCHTESYMVINLVIMSLVFNRAKVSLKSVYSGGIYQSYFNI